MTSAEQARAVEIGRRIQEKRSYFGAERWQTAAEVGIPESELEDIELGRIDARREILYKIAVNLGADYRWLVGASKQFY